MSSISNIDKSSLGSVPSAFYLHPLSLPVTAYNLYVCPLYFCNNTRPHLTLSNQSSRWWSSFFSALKSLLIGSRKVGLKDGLIFGIQSSEFMLKLPPLRKFLAPDLIFVQFYSLLLDRYLAMTYKRKSQKIPFQYWVSCTFQLQQTQLFASMILSETLWREWSTTLLDPLISIHVWFLSTTFCNHRGGVELKAYWKFPNLVG